jgi:hypothetical protein
MYGCENQNNFEAAQSRDFFPEIFSGQGNAGGIRCRRGQLMMYFEDDEAAAIQISDRPFGMATTTLPCTPRPSSQLTSNLPSFLSL